MFTLTSKGIRENYTEPCFAVFFFVIGDFNFGAVRYGRNVARDVDAHPQIIEDVDAVEALLYEDAMARLREIHRRREIEFAAFYDEAVSEMNRHATGRIYVPVNWYPLGAVLEVERAKSHPTTPPSTDRGCRSKPMLSFILDTAV